MTLMREDSSGPTPLLKGSPMDAWRETELAWSLTDAYAIARTRTGPRYTRHVVRGRRLDQSRLDRVYLSNSASWLLAVNSILHDSKEALSDHYPVVVEANLSNRVRKRRQKRDVYIKVDVDSLRNPGRRARVREVWEEGWKMSTDPIIAWELAWGRTREVFKQFRVEDKEKVSSLQEKRSELEQLRSEIEVAADDRTMRSLATTKVWALQSNRNSEAAAQRRR
ncbi:hypothetical protein R1sor_000925 [Riccia sorocarpa]|uniref:Endonuclease/exonuclease/phosphatase domain-containing protein n=1 Tax=Riccia sorocarpa TaxID=122646 RepID=A0ABD3GUT9_9MARC